MGYHTRLKAEEKSSSMLSKCVSDPDKNMTHMCHLWDFQAYFKTVLECDLFLLLCVFFANSHLKRAVFLSSQWPLGMSEPKHWSESQISQYRAIIKHTFFYHRFSSSFWVWKAIEWKNVKIFFWVLPSSKIGVWIMRENKTAQVKPLRMETDAQLSRCPLGCLMVLHGRSRRIAVGFLCALTASVHIAR